MKLSKNTLDILSNFSRLNQSIIIKKGNVLRTVNLEGSAYARAEVAEDFPVDFALYNLNEFLTVIKDLFNNSPDDIEFGQEAMTIVKGDTKAKYRYTSMSRVKGMERDVKSREPIFTFKMGSDLIQKVVKSRSIMGLDFLVVEVRDGDVYASGSIDRKGKSRTNVSNDNEFSVKLGSYNGKSDLDGSRFAVKIEYLTMMPLDYDVGVHVNPEKGGGGLSFVNDNLKYIIMLDKINSDISGIEVEE